MITGQFPRQRTNMKITIDRLKEIIKEELEQQDSLSDFTKGATQVTRTQTDRQAVQKSLEILASELQKQDSLQKKAQSVGLIMQKLGILPDELVKIANFLRTKD